MIVSVYLFTCHHIYLHTLFDYANHFENATLDDLHSHILRHEIDYLQFSFRWMNNLLMRELPLRCTIRLWDTYLAEPDGCGSILIYVCAAFLGHWREQIIKQKDFQVFDIFTHLCKQA